jgi:hypothetical protein
LVNIDVVDLRLDLKYLLSGTGHVVIERFKVREVRDVDVELWVGLRVDVVQREGVAWEKAHTVDCRCVWEERRGEEKNIKESTISFVVCVFVCERGEGGRKRVL